VKHGLGYPKEYGDKMCVDESNRKPIPDKAACEAAATSMVLQWKRRTRGGVKI